MAQRAIKNLVCGTAAAALIAGVSVTLTRAQDNLFTRPSGEITFGDQAEPTFDVAPIDPIYEKRLKRAEKKRLKDEEQLRKLNDALVVSKEREAVLAADVAALDKDRKSLTENLIKTARSIQRLEDEVAASERKLVRLSLRETKLQRSLVSRRAVLSEVLGALQRVGQNPPPAMFVAASDALSSVRSAILLGSVLPELRQEARQLVADLEELRALVASIGLEQNERVAKETQLSEEQIRLDLLIKENRKLSRTSNKKLTAHRGDANKLAANATNLRDLIEKTGGEIERITAEATKAQTDAERDAAKRKTAYLLQKKREEETVAALSRLKPAAKPVEEPVTKETTLVAAYSPTNDVALPDNERARVTVDYSTVLNERKPVGDNNFRKMKGKLALPARGVILKEFGDRDGLGGKAKGVTVQTRPEARVTAPASGRIIFAGPFSGFEKLLIMDVGGGHHIVLAGMDHINVKIGDLVAMGEPVATMGNKRVAHLAGLASDAATALKNNFSPSQTQPLLYVELRRNAKAITSSGWWSKS